MANLPPRIPGATASEVAAATSSAFQTQKMPSMSCLSAAAATSSGANPPWVDEFLDFSSAKRGLHRRSASDSIAFLEIPPPPPVAVEGQFRGHGEFDRFDDEQFMSMFTDEMSGPVPGPGPGSTAAAATAPVGSSNLPTPTSRNGISEEKEAGTATPSNALPKHSPEKAQPKNELEEGESSCELEAEQTPQPTVDTPMERIVDPKRVKRILANRQSAQRSRVRKLQYISELERSVTSLQTEVSVLSPRVAFLDHQRLLLNVDNSALKQRIAALAQDKIFKDAHQEALKREIERLRQVYHQQALKKMENGAQAPSTQPLASPRGRDSLDQNE